MSVTYEPGEEAAYRVGAGAKQFVAELVENYRLGIMDPDPDVLHWCPTLFLCHDGRVDVDIVRMSGVGRAGICENLTQEVAEQRGDAAAIMVAEYAAGPGLQPQEIFVTVVGYGLRVLELRAKVKRQRRRGDMRLGRWKLLMAHSERDLSYPDYAAAIYDGFISGGHTNVHPSADRFFQSLRTRQPAPGTDAGHIEDLLSGHWVSPCIEELELGVRSYNCLKRAGIHMVDDLLSMSERELEAIPYFGRKSIDEIIEVLASHGLTLREEDSPDAGEAS